MAAVLFRRMSLSYRSGLAIVLLTAILTHLPMHFNVLSTDDFLIRAMVSGDAMIFDKGLHKADPDKSWLQGLSDAFHFYSPDAGTLADYRNYGNLPWWAGDEAKMNPWRPLSAFTHWLDFQIAPDSFPFQAFHSMLYILLFAYCGYRLFWRLSPKPSVAVLASLMLIVDYSHYLNFNWIAARNVFIAGALGCAMLEQFILWREQGNNGRLLAALALLALGLLSAESSVALTGYLFAYMVFVEKARLPVLIRGLLPFALLVVGWRLLYNQMGFGASGISLYVDPGRSPLEFLTTVLQTMPVLLASTITSVDGAIGSMSPELKRWMAVGSALLVLLCFRLIVPLLKNNNWVRFMFAGSVLAAVPASALVSAGPRAGVFICIGFFWVFSLWLHHFLHNSPSRGARWLVQSALGLHLLLPTLLGLVLTSRLLPVVLQDDQQYQSVARPLFEQAGDMSVVVVNPHAPNRYFYLPFEWRYENGVLPNSVNQLAPGLVSFDLKRLSALEFEMTAPQGLPLTAAATIKDLQGNSPRLSDVYSSQLLQGLFTSPDTAFHAGVVRNAGDMRIQVQESVEGRPTRLLIRFDAARSPDHMAWQWYDWNSREYRAMKPLAIGTSRHFAGPLDTDKGSIVKFCMGCEEADSAN